MVGSDRYGWDGEGCDEVSGLPGTQNVVDCTPPSLCNSMWHASQAHGVGMIVISGDRHEFAATKLIDETGVLPGEVTEFSVSPLNMFYLPRRTYKQQDDGDVPIK